MAELHLIRHGQASFEAADYDCLFEVGVQQSRWLGTHLTEQGRQFGRLYTGSLQRHHQTAHALLEGLGCSVPIEAHPGLNEYDFRAPLQIAKTQGAVLPDRPRGDRKAFSQALRQVLILWSQARLPSLQHTGMPAGGFQRHTAPGATGPADVPDVCVIHEGLLERECKLLAPCLAMLTNPMVHHP